MVPPNWIKMEPVSNDYQDNIYKSNCVELRLLGLTQQLPHLVI